MVWGLSQLRTIRFMGRDGMVKMRNLLYHALTKKDNGRGSKMMKTSQYDEGLALHHPTINTLFQGLNRIQYSPTGKNPYFLEQ